jgi:hypothetical protein
LGASYRERNNGNTMLKLPMQEPAFQKVKEERKDKLEIFGKMSNTH